MKTLSIGRKELQLFANSFLSGGYYPNPDDSGPIGPWGPVIKKALYKTGLTLGTSRNKYEFLAQLNPKIWDIWGNPLQQVALNPQPLPPQLVFAASLATEVIERAELMQDLFQYSDVRLDVAGYINAFTDDLCPDPPRIKKPKGPWPPDPDPDPRWSPAELMIIGMSIQQAAAGFADAAVQKAIGAAANKIMDTAAERF